MGKRVQTLDPIEKAHPKPGEAVVADLSLDFDFFSRELFEWDWGHSESGTNRLLFLAYVWPSRYHSLGAALYDESSIETHADFAPEQVQAALAEKNIHLVNPIAPFRQLAIAESHRHAYPFFLDAWGVNRKFRTPDLFLQLDAHHDLWPLDPEHGIDCGNWLTALHKVRPTLNVLQVYPTWKDPSLDGAPAVDEASTIRWHDLPRSESPIWIRHIFLCRSGQWLPPHHDTRFLKLVYELAAGCNRFKPRVLEDLVDRTKFVVERDEAERQRADQMETFRQLRATQQASKEADHG